MLLTVHSYTEHITRWREDVNFRFNPLLQTDFQRVVDDLRDVSCKLVFLKTRLKCQSKSWPSNLTVPLDHFLNRPK